MNTLFEQALEAERGGRYSDAYRLFQHCLGELDSDPGDVYFHLGWCLEQIRVGDRQEALAYYQLAGELASTPECRINGMFRAAWLLMHEKRYAKAAAMFRLAVDGCEHQHLTTGMYHHAMYWNAVCLESLGLYLEALRWYRSVQKMSAQLDPESRYRQIVCLNQIGSYREALRVCMSFDDSPPAGFDEARYGDLRGSALRERSMLEALLSGDEPAHTRPPSYARD